MNRLSRGVDLFGITVLGIVTAIGGGLVRDVLAGCQTLLMSRELHAIPVLLGCTLFVVVLEVAPEYRAVAIHWNLSVPAWLATKPKTDSRHG